MGSCQTHPQTGQQLQDQTVRNRFNPFFQPQSNDHKELAILSKYQFISNYQDRFLGRCSIISNRSTKDLYLCKDIVFDKDEQCQPFYQYLLQKKQQQINCEQLLRIKEIFHKKVEGFLYDSKKIMLLLQYPLISLKKQFHNRLLNKLQFDKDEITKILYSAIRGYANIQRGNTQNSKVRMAHIFVGVQSKQSTIKVIDSSLLNAPTNLQTLILHGANSNQHHDIYPSPEQFEAYFMKNNLGASPTSGVFSLGITILDLCLMQSSRNAYHFHRKIFDQKDINNLIKIAGKKHGNNIQKFLTQMLDFDKTKRPSFSVLQSRIPNLFRQSGVGASALRLSVVKKDQSIYIANDAKSLRNSKVGSVYSSRSSQSANRMFASSIQIIQPNDQEIQNLHQQYTNGNQYIGQKKNGLKHGKGKYIFRDRSYYQGMWKNNMMHGKGSLYLPNGKLQYEGEWAEDEPDGWGVYYSYESDRKPYIWKKYEGQLRKGQMDGRGKLFFSNGIIYEGQFKLGKIFGHGRQITEQGTVFEREWQLQTLDQFIKGCESSLYVREQ